jgi:hypothetical protein
MHAQVVDDSQCNGQKSATVAAESVKKCVKTQGPLANKTVAPLSACRFTGLKWSTMVCRPDRRQDPKVMQKAIPSLYPSWLFSWAIRVLPHKGSHD